MAANNPYNGGTHLPDITVITPVFAPTAGGTDPATSAPAKSAPAKSTAQPLFFVASRGHHGDVGGLTPGSMPPFSQCIDEEGLLLDNVTLLSAGHFDGPGWRQRLAAGPFPVRDPDRLLADLQAQLAANQLGATELQALVQREGIGPVQRAMAQVQAHGAAAVRRVIDRLQDGSHRLNLDDGSQLQVVVTVDRERRRARLDFTGSSEQQAGNRNAPLAITKAVVLYVFRTLVGEEIPLNAGCFEPLDLVVPAGCLLHPRPPAAVVAGNVETSQALANLLFAALGVMASAQGTMNNLSFGNDRCQYYETIGGGTGAGFFEPTGFAGADAIQSHMTNSRLTDPEILEARYPVRVEHFGIRRGSGGEGRWRGGEGLIRELRFLEPLSVALISGSRLQPPQGLAGGRPSASGLNLLIPANGDPEVLPGCFERQLAAGDRLRIETPGGGGYGSPSGPPSQPVLPWKVAPRPWPLVALLALLAMETLGVGLAAFLVPPTARAELPPAVYAKRQRQAAVVLDLEVQRISRIGTELHIRAKVLAVRRQPRGSSLEAGQRIDLFYSHPERHPARWVGPGPIPVLQRGQQTRAWLNPLADRPGGFTPAAGSKSFEEIRSP